MTGERQIFLFVVWAKARPFEDEIRSTLAHDFNIMLETEISWPRRDFTRKLREFYGFGSRFTWWNKARKCGRGPFKVFLVEDTRPEFKPEIDTRGQRLLVDERVYRDKRSLRHLTRHSNIIHSSVTAEETDAQIKVLFGCGTEEFLSLLSGEFKSLGMETHRSSHEISDADSTERNSYGVPAVEKLEALLASGKCERLGMGSRRVCLAIPGTNLCLKGYRSEEEIALGKHPGKKPFKPLADSVVHEIRKCRFSDSENTSCQEWRYYQTLKNTLPSSLMGVFPEFLERTLLPSRGWCLVENVIGNADGSPVEKFHVAYMAADGRRRTELLRRLAELEDWLERYSVRFYDPQNVMVQWLADGDFRLRIIDFEPISRTLVSLDNLCAALVRFKVRRRFARYRRIMKW